MNYSNEMKGTFKKLNIWCEDCFDIGKGEQKR